LSLEAEPTVHTATLLSQSIASLFLVSFILIESLFCSCTLCRSVAIALCSPDVFVTDFSFQTPEEGIFDHV